MTSSHERKLRQVQAESDRLMFDHNLGDETRARWQEVVDKSLMAWAGVVFDPDALATKERLRLHCGSCGERIGPNRCDVG